MMPRPSERVAIVTGGTGALGQAVTLRLLADGARVAVPWIVKEEQARLLARLPADARNRVFTAEADVVDDARLGAFLDMVLARFGRADTLVSLVGGFVGGRLVETDRGTWDRLLAMNLTSAFTACRAVLPRMLDARYGRIVLTASRAVLPPAAGLFAFVFYSGSPSGCCRRRLSAWCKASFADIADVALHATSAMSANA